MNTYDDSDEHTDNWNDYLTNINERYDQMYSLINYNQFINEEVRMMDKRIRFLNKDYDKLQGDYNDLIKRYDNVKDNYNEIKDKYDKLKGKSDTSSSKRMRDDSKWLSSEKRKRPRNYEYLNREETKRRIDNIFSKIKTLDDIINLKNEEKRHDFFGNDKFDKLYKIIPCLEELNNMIGMKGIKKDIFDTICFFIHGLNYKEELNHVVITGDPGVGKTTMIQALGRTVGSQVVRINLSEQTDIVDLFGSDLPVPLDDEIAEHEEDASRPLFCWKDGILLEAMKRGDWVLLDEINLDGRCKTPEIAIYIIYFRSASLFDKPLAKASTTRSARVY